jgi:PadR family transcriptional regulator, regulatory protein PadR
MDRTTVSYSAALVLQALAHGVGYGFEVMRATDLPSGTVYPLLRRLEDGGLVRSRWENESKAHGEGRPPRRYYEITAAGARSLASAKGRLAAQRALFDRSVPDGSR